MRLRFAKDKEENWYQYVVEKEERDIEFVDFTGSTIESNRNDQNAGWIQWRVSPGRPYHHGRPVLDLFYARRDRTLLQYNVRRRSLSQRYGILY